MAVKLFHTCHSEATLPSPFHLPLTLCPPSPSFSVTLPPVLPLFLPRTSMEHHCHAARWCIHPFGRTHTLLLVFPPCWADSSSSSLGLVSQILRVRSVLSGGEWGGQLNIYGSTSIQMFGNGGSLWPENWHDLFVHNMQQGRYQRLSSACVSVCVCCCVFCSSSVGRWCYCSGHIFSLWASLLESRSYYLTDQLRETLVAVSGQANTQQNSRAEQIMGKIS